MTASEEKVLKYLLDVTHLPNQPLALQASLTAMIELVTSTAGAKHVKYLLQNGLVEVLSRCFDNAGVKGQPYNSIIAMVGMKLVYHLSRLWYLIVDPIMTESFFKRLLNFADKDGDLFEFSEEFHKEFTSLVLGKQLIANVVKEKMCAEKNKALVEQGVASLADVPKCVYKCGLFDTRGEKDLDINQELIDKNLIWPSQDAELEETHNWHDVVITNIIQRNYFYALVGKESIRQVNLIGSMIEPSDLHPAVVEEGKIVVVVRVKEDSSKDYFRGQIVSHHGDWVKTNLLDHGGILDVKKDRVFELPSALGLMYFPPQISLCYLAGVTASPVDSYTCQLAVASLCNLIRHNVMSGLALLKTNSTKILRPVLFCPDPVLVLQTIRVLNNLASNPRTDHDLFQQVLIDMLQLLRVLDERQWSIKIKEDISYAIFSCLTNTLHMRKEYRTLFYQNEGLKLVLVVMAKQHQHHNRPLNKMARQLLRNFLPSMQRNQQIRRNQEIQPTVQESKSVSNGLEKVMEKTNEDNEDVVSLRNTIGKLDTGFKQTREEDAMSTDTEKSEEQNLSGLKTALQGKRLLQTGEAFLYDSEVPFCDDRTHDLRPHSRLQDVKENSITESVCGMLNSEGGTIYFGIREGRVEGMRVSRDARDAFRLGVDQTIQIQVVPPALFNQYELVYTPVLQKNPSSHLPHQYIHVPDLYVIEIRVHKSRDVVHTVKASEQCFFRFGPNNLKLSAKDVREIVILAEEDFYKEEIITLRHRVQRLRGAAS